MHMGHNKHTQKGGWLRHTAGGAAANEEAPASSTCSLSSARNSHLDPAVFHVSRSSEESLPSANRTCCFKQATSQQVSSSMSTMILCCRDADAAATASAHLLRRAVAVRVKAQGWWCW